MSRVIDTTTEMVAAQRKLISGWNKPLCTRMPGFPKGGDEAAEGKNKERNTKMAKTTTKKQTAKKPAAAKKPAVKKATATAKKKKSR